MPPGVSRSSLEDLAQLADAVFARQVRHHLRPENDDKYLAIDVKIGAYEVDADSYHASERLHARNPGAEVWLRRTNDPCVCRFGWRLTYGNSMPDETQNEGV